MIIVPEVPTPNDLTKLSKQIYNLYKNNIRKIFLCGAIGESFSLTLEERMYLLSKWIAIIRKNECQMKIIYHIGTENLKDTNRLSKFADNFEEVEALAVMAPRFYKPKKIEEIGKYITMIDTKKPIYYYHIPHITHINYKMKELLDLNIPRLKGILFYSIDLNDLYECSKTEYKIYFGLEEWVPHILHIEIEGIIGGVYNIEELYKIYEKMVKLKEIEDEEMKNLLYFI
jgi:N-acetylneuraminate lyase